MKIVRNVTEKWGRQDNIFLTKLGIITMTCVSTKRIITAFIRRSSQLHNIYYQSNRSM